MHKRAVIDGCLGQRAFVNVCEVQSGRKEAVGNVMENGLKLGDGRAVVCVMMRRGKTDPGAFGRLKHGDRGDLMAAFDGEAATADILVQTAQLLVA